ncbi:putative ABC-type branched-chain amino acid transport systems periplasmic component-like protein [Frankia canadensis]|uniref:Putative ABC-type branched-chain amino acid transport systems periplasmic component-like protein n=1 Tax=Frankia canadensis TaxID=1836972 RepID=A0A2I2KMD6_9ACTN|nr:ABC transporter substrate-binding protein [Frankia canadensis]SNQ46837.1 putative ABC-type branched-chain amino acid transport systems periplasmic component-like protein [Frankia canadensis]SOU54127.1 putative ABC-type branched-chain amino acid transport systems periplasmic component-like protein [Frankia canadensis]
MRPFRRSIAGGIALCAAVVMSACGSDSTGSDAKPHGVVITVIAPTKSIPPTFPDVIAGAKAAATAVNAKGGIGGRQIEIQACNDNNNPNDAAKCARQAVADHSVAVAGSFTDFGSSIVPILARSGIPYLGFGATTPTEYACATCYPIDAGSVLAFAGLPGALRSQGAKTVTTVTVDLAAAAANVKGVEAAAKAAGLQTMSAVKVAATSTDLAPAVQAVVRTKADAVVVILSHELTLSFIKAADQAKAPFTIGVVDGAVQSSVSKIRGTADDKLMLVGAYPPVDDTAAYPGLARYKAELDAAVKGGDSDAALRSSSSLRAWLAVHVVAQVAGKISGDITAASLNGALRTAKDVDLFGILPPWTPSAKGHVPGFDRASSARVFFMRLNDGKFSLAKPITGVDLNSGKPL